MAKPQRPGSARPDLARSPRRRAGIARAPLTGALAVSAALHVGCTPPPSFGAPAAEARRAGPDVEVHLPPPDRCGQQELAPRLPAAIAPDTAPLSVQVNPKGVSLETSGASAGRVLIGIGAAAQRSIRVQGYGAHVRIYAHVVDMPWEALVEAVARAAWLVIQRSPDGEMTVVDPADAVRLERSRRAAQIDLVPIETRLVPARHPAEVAPVLARLLLGCGGEVISAPRSSLLVIRGRMRSLDRMEALIEALEREPPAPIRMDLDQPPGPITYGIPDATTPSCDAIAVVPAPPVPDGRLFVDGGAAGDLLRQIARARGTDVVVGCGGDRPAFFRGAVDLEMDQIALSIGLARIAPGTFTSDAVAREQSRLSVIRTRKGGPYLLRGLVAPRPEELAVVANRLLAPRGTAVAYAPASMLVVAGGRQEIALVESLVKAWNEPVRTPAKR